MSVWRYLLIQVGLTALGALGIVKVSAICGPAMALVVTLFGTWWTVSCGIRREAAGDVPRPQE